MKVRIVSFFDLFAVAACGLVFGSLLALKVQSQRSHARGSACGDKLKTIGLGLHNYHAAYKQLPQGSGGTHLGSEAEPLRGNANRLSAFVGILPFIEEQRTWEIISNPYNDGSKTFPPMGPVPWYSPEEYKPWSMRSAMYACPSDSVRERLDRYRRPVATRRC